MFGMEPLTQKQQQIVEFIEQQQQQGYSPSYRDIADHFNFRSLCTVADHIRLIKKKGHLTNDFGKARSFRLTSAFDRSKNPIVAIPIFGSIPAGIAENKSQEVEGCVSVDVNTLGFRPSTHTFGLRVTGESMIGRHILPGDVVILEDGLQAKQGDVVAALIDNESTLKTYVVENGSPFLRAENPKFPDLMPASELSIQGVMRFLYRKDQ